VQTSPALLLNFTSGTIRFGNKQPTTTTCKKQQAARRFELTGALLLVLSIPFFHEDLAMDAKLLPCFLLASFECDRPAIVVGKPGASKTALAERAAQLWGEILAARGQIDCATDCEYRTRRASGMDPAEFGIPDFADSSAAVGTFKYKRPDWLPTSGFGVFNFDDLADAPLLVQSALYDLILTGKLDDYTKPPGWRFTATGNRVSDRAAAGRFSTALANRFTHATLEPSAEAWISWALDSEYLDPATEAYIEQQQKADIPKHRPPIKAEVASLVRFRPELIDTFDPASPDPAFGSARTLHILSDFLWVNPSPAIELELFQGIIGHGPGIEAAGFFKVWRDLPNPQAILDDPDSEPMPTEPSVQYAICGALARLADAKSADAICRYANRFKEAGSVEFCFVLAEDSARRSAAFKRTEAYIGWCTENQQNLT
jgi:hypothetical protein